MKLEKTLEDRIGKMVYDTIKTGIKLQPTLGKTARGNMIGYIYTSDMNAVVRIQAFTKDTKKNALFVITVTPEGGASAEITGKYARLAFHYANDYKKSYYKKTKEAPSDEVVSDALSALGVV